ncbi:unnamed protein product [Coregonus sp. 'balchen']|nr:unnamed protein product [Coregonus sp. 'balchen']
MAGGQDHQSARGAGLRNTLQFVWKNKGKQIGNREWFIRTVIIEGLRVDPGHVYCLQRNTAAEGYDLSLNSQALYRRCMDICKEKATSEPFSNFQVFPLCRLDLKIITVHMYNPYVGDDSIGAFLGRFGKVSPGVRYLRDGYGIWSGRRQFRVVLNRDPEGVDKLVHPPAYFSIGADRGYLFYSGQPSFCRHCRSFGHLATGCTLLKCRNCGKPGHGAANCREARVCNGCGKQGHIFKDCPKRQRTYADAAGDGLVVDAANSPLRPIEEVLKEIRAVADEMGKAPGGSAAEEVQTTETLEEMELLTGAWEDSPLSEMSDDSATPTRSRKMRSSSAGGATGSASSGNEQSSLEYKGKRRKRRRVTDRGLVEEHRRPSVAVSNRFAVLNPDTGDEGLEVGVEIQDPGSLKAPALEVSEASIGSTGDKVQGSCLGLAVSGKGASGVDTDPEEVSMECAQVLPGGDCSSSSGEGSLVCGQVPTRVDSSSSPERSFVAPGTLNSDLYLEEVSGSGMGEGPV